MTALQVFTPLKWESDSVSDKLAQNVVNMGLYVFMQQQQKKAGGFIWLMFGCFFFSSLVQVFAWERGLLPLANPLEEEFGSKIVPEGWMR